MEEDDYELQQALALSLQEYQGGTSAPPPASAKPSPLSCKGKPAGSVPSPAAPKAAATAAAKQPQGRKKKLPTFAPTAAETEDLFREMGCYKTRISMGDLINEAAKLGLDLDEHKARGMIDYALQHGLLHQGLQQGGISLADFKTIVDHFRVE